MMKYKKRPRLKGFGYRGFYRYFITICTHERAPIFYDGLMVERMVAALKKKAVDFRFRVWVYCFMPDHLHLLLEGDSPDSDLKRFIASYKQYTGYHYRKTLARDAAEDKVSVAQGFSPAEKAALKRCATDYEDVVQGFSPAKLQGPNPARLWQPSYYDHVLRKDEDTVAVARYILENPVRKDLVEHFKEYRFSGSFAMELDRLL